MMRTASEMPAASLGAGFKAAVLRRLVGDTDFTVVSNNCWGAHIYQALGMAYRTPFVGLFIPPQSYLLLLERFDERMAADLTFVGDSRVEAVNAWRDREGLTYPIALLDGCVELHFQHYANPAEARSKWRRRCERMTLDPRRRFFKFDDRDAAADEDIRAFCALPLINKVCFTAAAHDVPTVVVPPEPGETQAPDGVRLATVARARFNTLRWISALPAVLPLPSLI